LKREIIPFVSDTSVKAWPKKSILEGLAKFYAQRQKSSKSRAEPNSFGFCRGAADFIKILWIISRQLCLALQYHDAR